MVGGTLRQSATSGVRWSFVSLGGRQVLRLGSSLVLARLVGPESFGIAAQATVIIAFLTLFQDQGFGAALVQRKDLRSSHIGTVFWLNVSASLVLAGGVMLSAPAIAGFYGTPEVEGVMRALAVSTAITGLSVVPRSLLTRRIAFRPIALAEVGSAVVGGAAGIAAALGGADYWAFVVQILVNDAVYAAVLLVQSGRTTYAPSRVALRELWRFSSLVMAFQVVNYLIRNLDNVIVGRVLGPVELAYYALSYRIMMLPVQNLGQVVNRVVFPIYSRVQDDLPRMQRMFFSASRSIGIIAMPPILLLALSAPTLIPFAFGEDWTRAVVPLQVLALTGLRQSIMTMNGPIFMARGRADLQLRVTIVSGAVLIGSFLIGVRFGIVGVAVAYSVASTITDTVVLVLIGRLIEFRLREFVVELVPALVGAAALAGAWFVLALALAPADLPPTIEMTVSGVAAVGAYLGVIFGPYRQRTRDTIFFIRETVPVRRGPEAA